MIPEAYSGIPLIPVLSEDFIARRFIGKATLTGSKGLAMNVPKKAAQQLGVKRGDLLLVFVEDGRIILESAAVLDAAAAKEKDGS